MYVFLTGAPGAGKSAVAPHLAALFGARWFDLDERIARRAGRPIAEIFTRDGEARFRDLERQAVADLPRSFAWTVVATGGGTVVDPQNRRRMRELGVLVNLGAGLRALVMRTREGERPLLAGDRRARLRSLLRARRAAYADADVRVRTEGREPKALAEAIAAAVVAGRGAEISVADAYRVHVHAGSLGELGALALAVGVARRVALVTDGALARHLASRALRSLQDAGLEPRLLRVPRGERAKTSAVLARLWRELARAELGRDDGVAALGGGSVTDLAGFAAATYARGVRWIAVPTTLLGMVDAAIGGKTAVDLPEGKNLAGAFHNPRAVLADTALLATLPAREVRSGLAEIVKCAVLADADLLAQLERLAARLRDGDAIALFAAVVAGADVKASIVTRDPREEGERMALNLGHTLGHALETATIYRRYTHGEAVALGTLFACAVAETLGLARAGLRERVESLLDDLGLPVRTRVPERAWTLLARDKKRRAGKLRWVLPRRLGTVSVVEDVPERALRRAAATLEGRMHR